MASPFYITLISPWSGHYTNYNLQIIPHDWRLTVNQESNHQLPNLLLRCIFNAYTILQYNMFVIFLHTCEPLGSSVFRCITPTVKVDSFCIIKWASTNCDFPWLLRACLCTSSEEESLVPFPWKCIFNGEGSDSYFCAKLGKAPIFSNLPQQLRLHRTETCSQKWKWCSVSAETSLHKLALKDLIKKIQKIVLNGQYGHFKMEASEMHYKATKWTS